MKATGANGQRTQTARHQAGKVGSRTRTVLLPTRRESFSQPLPKQFTTIYSAPLKKILKTVLTPYIHPNITGADESRGPAISRNYERRRDASTYAHFERLFRSGRARHDLAVQRVGIECTGFA
jgi:hypothetical protein